MNFDVDLAIIIAFLLINLIVGLYHGRHIKNIAVYALGGRNFSTATLSATIIATWIGGGFFASALSETYKEGLWHVFARFGDVLTLLIVGYLIAPRVWSFLGKLSVAEIMGDLYGKNVRTITSIASIALCIGSVAVQIKLLSALFNHFFHFSNIYAVLISSSIVIAYSAFGGIKSVTFTDAVQFLTFGITLPIVALLIWNIFNNPPGLIVDTVKTNPLFDYRQIFDYNDPKFYVALMLFLYYTIPGLDPSTFHRILMAKNIAQVRKSFIIAAILCLFIGATACFIGTILLAHNPNLNPDNLVMYVVDNYSYSGFKGLILIGIMAMIMSTADSYLNSASVIFSYDFCKTLNINFPQTELFISRIFACFAGIIAVILALSTTGLFKLLLLVGNFYTPVITMPLMLAIFGFRTTPRVALLAITTGIMTVIIWRIYIQPLTDIDSIIPGTIANLLTLLLVHYLLREPGGWNNKMEIVKVKKQSFKKNCSSFFYNLKNVNPIEYCRLHSPKQQIIYIYFAFAVLSIIISTFTLSSEVYQQHIILINILQAIVLFIVTAFICNGLWPEDIREKYIGIIWYISNFVSLAFISSLLVLLSGFAQIALIIFIINLTVIGMLLRWQIALTLIILGVLSAFFIYQSYIGDFTPVEIYDIRLKILYVLFVIGGFTLAFLKPKQEYLEATEEKADTLETEVTHLNYQVTNLNENVTHYSQRISDQAKEIERLGATAQKILNNVNHELRLPIGNVVNFAEMLNEGLEKYSKDQLKELSDEVLKNSTRLSSMILNMLDLATLSARTIELQKKTLNLGLLVEERVKTCRNIYLQKKKIDFELSIAQNLLIDVDPNYMRQTVDNLVINAITFSEKGVIKISVTKQQNVAVFVITNEGKPIPHTELHDIFTAFRMASNTESKAEGRGVGLALCKAAIEAHGGMIKAENTGKGAKFRFVLPL